MKIYFAISLLSIYLISLTEASQLIKLPLLIEHFTEHKKKDKNLSLWEFLTMHYTHTDDHDGDRDEDMKLPFKSHNGCVNSLDIVFVADSFENFLTKQYGSSDKSYVIYSENSHPSSYLSFIWQPPKTC